MVKKTEQGQAILLVVVAMGIFLVGALGFAVDGATLYGHRTMAQTAADGAAQAAALSILNATNTAANNNAFTGGPFTCASGSTYTPCSYAQLNGFATTDDQIDVAFPTSAPGVSGLSPDFTPNLVQVTISRAVPTTLMRLLGSTTSTVKATAIAAILQDISPVPIIVTHPTLPSSLKLGGNTVVKICGGPQRSIQVNSKGTAPSAGNALDTSGSWVLDMSKGGPADTSRDCTTPGNGTDVGVSGLPQEADLSIVRGVVGSCTRGLCLGTAGTYLQPASPIYDPLATVDPPTKPADAVTPVDVPAGSGECPSTAGSHGCTLYYAGNYPTGLQSKNSLAIFHPGLYYIDGAPTSGSFRGIGFGTDANGDAMMCSGASCGSDPTSSGCCDVNNGMLVFVSRNGGSVKVASNSSSTMLGSDGSSPYKSMLFFVARDAPAHTGTSAHSFGGGGALNLIGTIYATNCTPQMNTCRSGVNMTTTLYQEIDMRGNSGSGTTVRGEIIASVLTMNGGGNITMQLDPNLRLPINQVALVK